MKKYFAAVFILTALQGNAQKHTWEYGLQTGVNINSARGNGVNSSSKSTLTGFAIGGHMQYMLNQHVGIKAGLQFDQLGWSYRSLTLYGSGTSIFSTADALFRLNYLDLPVTAQYTSGKKIRFTSGAGIFVGTLLSSQFILKTKTPDPGTVKSKHEGTKTFNLGLAANAGIQIPLLHKLKLDIVIHNNLGLLNTHKRINDNSTSIRSNTFSFLAGLTWSR